MTAEMYATVSRAICADENTLTALGATNLHLGRIDPGTSEVLVSFDCETAAQRCDIARYLRGE